MDSGKMIDLIEIYREQGAPQDQQMLVALLREVQEEEGGAIAASALDAIAQGFAVKRTMLEALIRRVPGLRLENARHRLEVCGTCRAGAALRAYIEKTYGVKSGSVCQAAGFSYHVTPCMKNCKNGPSIRWDSVLYGGADEALVRSLIQGKEGKE